MITEHRVEMNRKDRKNFLLIIAAAGTGVYSTAFSGEHHNMLGLYSLIPLLWLETGTRRSAFLVPFAFYLAVSRGILPGAYVFFRDGSIVRSLALWILSATALSAPFGLLWVNRSVRNAKNTYRKSFQVILAIFASVPPPLGLIGWGNPLSVAGVFFPGFGWYGLALMLILYAGAAISSKLRRALMISVLFIVPFLYVPATPEKITVGDVTILSIDTSFGRMASGSADFDAQYERERYVFRFIHEKRLNGQLLGAGNKENRENRENRENKKIVILPETIIGRMYPTTMRRWERFFTPFAEEGIIFIVGGEVPTHRGLKYDNVMTSFERDGARQIRQIAKQRFPVPVSMFVPFSATGTNAYLMSLGEISIMEIHGKRLGFLICYEQFLTWPPLTLMSRRPDVIIGSANLWWCRDTSIPGIRAASLSLWGRLFDVPLISATNM